jgi:hypothetical protein
MDVTLVGKMVDAMELHLAVLTALLTAVQMAERLVRCWAVWLADEMAGNLVVPMAWR